MLILELHAISEAYYTSITLNKGGGGVPGSQSNSNSLNDDDEGGENLIQNISTTAEILEITIMMREKENPCRVLTLFLNLLLALQFNSQFLAGTPKSHRDPIFAIREIDFFEREPDIDLDMF